MKKKKRLWTEEKCEFLSDNWGHLTLKTICKKLDRTESAVCKKASLLGLGYACLASQHISMSQLTKAFYGYRANPIVVSSLIELGLPVYKKKFNKQTYMMVYIDNFCKWAEKNKAHLNFSRMEKKAYAA